MTTHGIRKVSKDQALAWYESIRMRKAVVTPIIAVEDTGVLINARFKNGLEYVSDKDSGKFSHRHVTRSPMEYVDKTFSDMYVEVQRADPDVSVLDHHLFVGKGKTFEEWLDSLPDNEWVLQCDEIAARRWLPHDIPPRVRFTKQSSAPAAEVDTKSSSTSQTRKPKPTKSHG